MVNKKDSFQVVKFMLNDGGGEAGEFFFLPLAVKVLETDFNGVRAGNQAVKTGNGKTALHLFRMAVKPRRDPGELRVDENEVMAAGEDDKQPFGLADLNGREANAEPLAFRAAGKGVNHVLNQLDDFFVDFGDRLGNLPEERVGNGDELKFHG